MEFMTLSVELRQLIIGIVVTSPADPPETPSASQHDCRVFKTKDSRDVGIWQRPLKNPALNMMLVNHKLHDEVKFYLQLAPGKYHVDIMSVKTYGLWTTWSISKMPTTRYIETVSCTFRLFEPTPDLDTRFADSVSFRGSDDGPPVGIWSFYALLENLFDLGSGYCLKNRRRPSFVVGTIVVDFLAPTDGAAHSSVTQPEAEFQQSLVSPLPFLRQEGRRPDGITPEETFAQLLAWYIEILFRLDYHTVKYGRFLSEPLLDRLVLLVNGKEHKVFDVEQIYKTHESKWGSISNNV